MADGAAVQPKFEPCSSPGSRKRSIPPAGALVIDLDSQDEQAEDLRPKRTEVVTTGTSKRPLDGTPAEPPAKKRKGSAAEKKQKGKTLTLGEKAVSHQQAWENRKQRGRKVGERAQVEVERQDAGTGRAPDIESSEGSAAISTCEPQLTHDTVLNNHRGQSVVAGDPQRFVDLDVTPPMRAGVNVSAFYPTLARVVTEYVDNAIAAILRLFNTGALEQGYLWVTYEGRTLTIRDNGPGMTKEAFERAIRPSGTGRGLLDYKTIQGAVGLLKGPTGRHSMSAASGQYGYGLFAGFSVADRITIMTKPPNQPTMKAELDKGKWDTMDTDWKMKVDIFNDTNNEHGTEVILLLRKEYWATPDCAEELRAALCAACSPFADVDNGLPGTLPQLFDGRLQQEKLLDSTLEKQFRASKKQPLIVNFNKAELFRDPEERMVNLEVALNMTPCSTEGPRLVRIPTTMELEKTALVCLGTMNTTVGRPAIPNYDDLFPDMFQVVWQHRGGIKGYTPKNLRALLGKDRLKGVIYLDENYKPMPPKDMISEECPMWRKLREAIDKSVRKLLEPLLQYFGQFDSNVSFEGLEKEVKGTKFFKKAVITSKGGTTVLRLTDILQVPSVDINNMVRLRSLFELPSGERRAEVCFLTCKGVRDDVIDISMDVLLDAKVKTKKQVEDYRKQLPSEVTCKVLGKPSGPRGNIKLEITLHGKHDEDVRMQDDMEVEILCNGRLETSEVLELPFSKVSLPVPSKAGLVQYGVRIHGWDITPDLKNEKARVMVPAGPPEKPVLKVEPKKVVRSGEEITLRVSFKDATGEDQAKLPRALKITAVIRGKQPAKSRSAAPILRLEKWKREDKDNRTAVLKGRLEGPKQNALLIVEMTWKGEKEMRDKIKAPLELTDGRPTTLCILSPQDLVVENGTELHGLTFGLSDGHNTLRDASEIRLTSDDVRFDGFAERKVRAGKSVRISCLDGKGVASEDGTKECKVSATYKEKGRDGQQLSIDFDLKVLPGKVPNRLGFEASEQKPVIRSGETFFAEGQLKAFVLGETGEKLQMEYANAFSIRWKPLGRKSTRGGSTPAKPTPLLKAAGFSDSGGTDVLFPEILAPPVVEEYELVLEMEDKLSEPQLHFSETVVPKVAVVAGPPAKIGMHGGPRKGQQFDEKKCHLPECSIFTLDASGNKCKELTEEISVGLMLVLNDETSTGTAPSLELPPEQDLLLGPLQAHVALKRVKLNQDGTTGFYDLAVEAGGLEAIRTTIFYTNSIELAQAAEEVKNLQEEQRTNEEAISRLGGKLSEIEENVEERERRMAELKTRLEEFEDQVASATQTYQEFEHRLVGTFAERLPPDVPALTESSINDVRDKIKEHIQRERNSLQRPQLGNGPVPSKVRMLAKHLRNQGVLGFLGELASAEDPRVCRALASLVLGPEKLCWLIVKDRVAKERCVSFLRSRNESWNNVPFIRLDGFSRPHSPGLDPRAPGCLGYAVNLITVDPRLSEEAQREVKAVVLNACRNTLLFETGAQAMDHKAFLLIQRSGGLPRMLSLDGHRLESNGVEYEGSGEDARMEYSLAQCGSQRLADLCAANDALDKLRELQGRCQRAKLAHGKRYAPDGEALQLEAEIEDLKRQNVEPEEEIQKLNDLLKELKIEQKRIADDLQALQATMSRTASPQSAAKAIDSPSVRKTSTPKTRSRHR